MSWEFIADLGSQEEFSLMVPPSAIFTAAAMSGPTEIILSEGPMRASSNREIGKR
jgi:hypothetical protein